MSHFHKLTIKDIKQETPECVSVAFNIPEELVSNFNYKSGQYLTLKTTIDGNEVRRSYSICTAEEDKELRVAIKKMAGGKFSTFANDVLKTGDTLDVMPPMGNFCLTDNSATKHYLAFAVGSGITPIYGLIQTVLKQNPNSTFTLVYGNKNRSTIIFKEGLEALKNKFIDRLTVHHVFTREKMDTEIFNGRINKEKAQVFEKVVDYNTFDEVFICGPEEVVIDLKNYFEENHSDKKVHFELFSSPDQPKVVSQEWIEKTKDIDTSKISRVTVRLDGTSFEFDLPYGGETILDAALKNGADLPFACKGGVCCTCRAKVTEGEVDMEVNYALEPDELEKNFVLTCQSHPRSEKVFIDFDIK
jgi:ring-1,2-phenylacetyl-CoA epoxidase subunit PaaE